AVGYPVNKDDSMFPPQPPESRLVLVPPLPGEWRGETLPDGSERIRFSRWGQWNINGGYVGTAVLLTAWMGLRLLYGHPLYLVPILLAISFGSLWEVLSQRE